MRIRILPYKAGSASAKALSEEGFLRLKRTGSRFKPREDDILINWGCDYVDNFPVGESILFNPPSFVNRVCNKLEFFEAFKGSSIPRHWTEKEEAAEYLLENGGIIVCRKYLTSHSGRGIVIANTPEELVDAPLYTLYIPKKDEYRIHLGWDKGAEYLAPISVQRKARKLDVPSEEVNWQIRNHDNGFIFQRHGFEVPEAVLEAAKEVFSLTGLHFGALDVVYNESQGKAYVLEVNTAPGLCGETLKDYTNYFNMFKN